MTNTHTDLDMIELAKQIIEARAAAAEGERAAARLPELERQMHEALYPVASFAVPDEPAEAPHPAEAAVEAIEAATDEPAEQIEPFAVHLNAWPYTSAAE